MPHNGVANILEGAYVDPGPVGFRTDLRQACLKPGWNLTRVWTALYGQASFILKTNSSHSQFSFSSLTSSGLKHNDLDADLTLKFKVGLLLTHNQILIFTFCGEADLFTLSDHTCFGWKSLVYTLKCFIFQCKKPHEVEISSKLKGRILGVLEQPHQS